MIASKTEWQVNIDVNANDPGVVLSRNPIELALNPKSVSTRGLNRNALLRLLGLLLLQYPEDEEGFQGTVSYGPEDEYPPGFEFDLWDVAYFDDDGDPIYFVHGVEVVPGNPAEKYWLKVAFDDPHDLYFFMDDFCDDLDSRSIRLLGTQQHEKTVL